MELNNKSLNEATPLLTTGQARTASDAVERDDAITSTTSEIMEVDVDFFGAAELGIANVSPDKITEDVEDIAQDLENLLGESSNTTYNFSKDRSVGSSNQINSSIKPKGLINQNRSSNSDKLDEIDLQQAIDGKLSSNPEQAVLTRTNEEKFKISDSQQIAEVSNAQVTESSSKVEDIKQIQINEVSTDTLNIQDANEVFADRRKANILNDDFEMFQSTLTKSFNFNLDGTTKEGIRTHPETTGTLKTVVTSEASEDIQTYPEITGKLTTVITSEATNAIEDILPTGMDVDNVITTTCTSSEKPEVNYQSPIGCESVLNVTDTKCVGESKEKDIIENNDTPVIQETENITIGDSAVFKNEEFFPESDDAVDIANENVDSQMQITFSNEGTTDSSKTPNVNDVDNNEIVSNAAEFEVTDVSVPVLAENQSKETLIDIGKTSVKGLNLNINEKESVQDFEKPSLNKGISKEVETIVADSENNTEGKEFVKESNNERSNAGGVIESLSITVEGKGVNEMIINEGCLIDPAEAVIQSSDINVENKEVERLTNESLCLPSNSETEYHNFATEITNTCETDKDDNKSSEEPQLITKEEISSLCIKDISEKNDNNTELQTNDSNIQALMVDESNSHTTQDHANTILENYEHTSELHTKGAAISEENENNTELQANDSNIETLMVKEINFHAIQESANVILEKDEHSSELQTKGNAVSEQNENNWELQTNDSGTVVLAVKETAQDRTNNILEKDVHSEEQTNDNANSTTTLKIENENNIKRELMGEECGNHENQGDQIPKQLDNIESEDSETFILDKAENVQKIEVDPEYDAKINNQNDDKCETNREVEDTCITESSTLTSNLIEVTQSNIQTILLEGDSGIIEHPICTITPNLEGISSTEITKLASPNLESAEQISGVSHEAATPSQPLNACANMEVASNTIKTIIKPGIDSATKIGHGMVLVPEFNESAIGEIGKTEIPKPINVETETNNCVPLVSSNDEVSCMIEGGGNVDDDIAKHENNSQTFHSSDKAAFDIEINKVNEANNCEQINQPVVENVSRDIDSNSLVSSDDFQRTNDTEIVAASVPLLYDSVDDETAVTTTETDNTVNSLISTEQISSLTAAELANSNNSSKFSQPNLITESASAVEALITAELYDTTVHSNTVGYESVSDVPQYKLPFTGTPAPKSFEPSVIELNCAVASILEESSNSAIAELEFQVAPVNHVSTSSTLQVESHCKEAVHTHPTYSVESNIESKCSQQQVSNQILKVQEEKTDISEELITQSNIVYAQETEIETLPSKNIEIEKNLQISVEKIQPLKVEVEDNLNEPKSSVSSTQIEKTETICEIISPESQKNMSSLKITIGKSDNSHSILKIYDPNEAQSHKEESVVPKITFKPIPTPEELQQSPKLNIKPIKPPEAPSPKIIIKPVLKPEPISPLKITIRPGKTPTSPKPHTKTEFGESLHHSPKITIKPVLKPREYGEGGIKNNPESEKLNVKTRVRSSEDFQDVADEKRCSPKLIIKPIVKPPEEELVISPRITIKPIVKPAEEIHHSEDKPKITIKPIKSPEECHSPKITIKPIIKPDELTASVEDKHIPKITIKPVVKPTETEPVTISRLVANTEKLNEVVKEQCTDPSSSHPLKLNIKPIPITTEDKHNTLEVEPTKTLDYNAHCTDSVQPLKLNIKPIVKPPETSILQSFLKSGELPKKPVELVDFEDEIKQERIILKIAKPSRRGRAPASQVGKVNPLKLKLDKDSLKRSLSIENDKNVKQIKGDVSQSCDSNPYMTRAKEQNRVHLNREEYSDPLTDIPIFEIVQQTSKETSPTYVEVEEVAITAVTAPPTPKKRGRPRKVPLEVREEFKDTKEGEEQDQPLAEEPIRPKRNCRGSYVRNTSSMKPKKPRAPRGRRGGGSSRATRSKLHKEQEQELPIGPLSLFPESIAIDCEQIDTEVKDAYFKPVPLPTETVNSNREVVIYEEETRMSAENSSRAQTPAKQVSSAEVIEESQSSVQSNATTESGEKIHKSRKGGRSEVYHDPDGEIVSADKLAEYSWGGGGPYMLQEQVAQFLGIKSFKRKYPGIQRRTVDMQERDFIRESCLASEAMCDMGLTAVKSEDILDIMYTDFQHKYEEYCKYQRDRQAKDVSNKQKALSLAASQEKNKIDIVEQAIQSAQQWNANFNKARKEQRRACMDLQTFTVHYPKGKMKQINKIPMGNYPLSLVPGQYSDHYKKYSPRELSALPLNTVGCGSNVEAEDSQSDGSGSDSDSSSSDSDSSSSGSSDDCKVCNTRSGIPKKQLVR